MAPRQSVLDFFRPWLLATAAAFVMAPELRPEAEAGSGTYTLLAYAVAALVSAYLFCPVRGLASPRAVLLWSAAAGAGVPAYGLTMAPPVPAFALFRLGFAVAVVLAVLLLARRAAERGLPDAAAGAGVALLGAACAAAPLWLSPWVERGDGAAWLIHLALGISPLTYFAVMLDCDYLRSTWFYEHTPFGAYRYAYPSPLLLTFIHAALGAVAAGVGRPRKEPRPETVLGDFST